MSAPSPYNQTQLHYPPPHHLHHHPLQPPTYVPHASSDSMLQTYPERTSSSSAFPHFTVGPSPAAYHGPETPGILGPQMSSTYPQQMGSNFDPPPSSELKEKSASLGTLDFGGVSMPDDDDNDENYKKEKDILNMNRVKLTEYVHDCTVLHPFMKEKKIFSKDDCQLIEHEVTGAQRMDKFVDIVLTKGPKAVGVFHESLGKSYPYVFDMLTRIFNSAGIQLPESRQIPQEPADPYMTLPDKNGTDTGMSTGHTRKPSVRKTIMRHIDELTERCEVVKNQRDELQKALLQRERDINSLLSQRDQQIHKNYEDMLQLLQNWRETVARQSDGSIEKMEELLSEQQEIRQDYELLEGDYLLVVSELSAARDRISKLLTHLQKMETEFSLAQEEKEALKDQLEVQQGDIQRLYRRIERMSKDPDRSPSLERDIDRHRNKAAQEKAQEEKIKELEEKMKVCQLERKYALDERDKFQLMFHEEKGKRKKADEEVLQLKASHRKLRHSSSEPPASYSYLDKLTGVYADDTFTATSKKPQALVEDTIFMPADDCGMEIGLAVVVRELSETGNAFKHGVRVGDEIHQVNHIKISSKDTDPLQFVQCLLERASPTVTLSIKRQPHPPHSSAGSASPQSHAPLRGSPSLVPQSTSSGGSVFPLGARPLSPLPSSPRPRPYELMVPRLGNPPGYSSLKSNETKDTSDELTEDSDGHAFSEPESYMYRISQSSLDTEGIVTSPKNSKYHYNPYDDFREGGSRISGDKWTLSGGTLNGTVFPEPSTRILTPEDDEETRVPHEKHHRHRPAIIRKRKSKRKKIFNAQNGRLSHSADDLAELISPQNDLTPGEFISCKEDGSRCVLLPFGQLGTGLFLTGGRGSGLYIRSERSTSRSLKTGDQILAINGKSTSKMTYAEAIELMNRYNTVNKECLLQVKYDKEGYEKLDLCTRDSFYVKANISYKSRARSELSFEKGDVFHVTDTLPSGGPSDLTNMWRVEKLDSRGGINATGCIPTTFLEHAECPSPSGNNSHSLPLVARRSPRLIDHMTMQAPGHLVKQSPPLGRKQVSAQSAFKLYLPVVKVNVTEPRPVIIMGVFEKELREYLVERGYKDGLKFAFPNREPAEKLTGMSEDKIVESISVSDGILHSTMEDVAEVTRSGHHCILTLTTVDIRKVKIRALHPIIIGLSPHSKTIRVKSTGGRLPTGFTQEVLNQSDISKIKDDIRKIQVFMTGEIEVSSAVNVEDLVVHICHLVVEQQRSVVWEADHMT